MEEAYIGRHLEFKTSMTLLNHRTDFHHVGELEAHVKFCSANVQIKIEITNNLPMSIVVRNVT